jgi:hypothetical protein
LERPREGPLRFFGHLARAARGRQPVAVEKRDEQVLFEALYDIQRKLDKLLELFAEDDDEEEEE